MNSNNNILNSKTFLFLFFHSFFYRCIICEIKIKDNFDYGKLEGQNNYFLDIRDYYNLSIIITASKVIYKGIPPQFQSNTNASINKYSSAITLNNNYLLVACLSDSLLTKININTGENTSLLDYSFNNNYFNPPEYICSISLINNTVYIAKSENSSNQILINKILKIYLSNISDEENGPNIINLDNSKNISFHSDKIGNIDRQITCETIKEESMNFDYLFCIYVKNNIITAVIINKDLGNIEFERSIINKNSIVSYRLYKLNNYNLKLLFNNQIIIILLIFKEGKINISFKQDKNFRSIQTPRNDFYDYNNNYLIKVSFEFRKYNTIFKNMTVFIIYYKDSDDFYKIYDKNGIDISKILIMYNEKEDKFLCIYQTSHIIKYFFFSENIDIYNIIQHQRTIKIESYKNISFDVANLFEPKKDFGLIDIYNFTESSSSLTKNVRDSDGYENLFTFKYQIITQKESSNNWIEYAFYFQDEIADYLREFILSTAKLKIQTCSFQCSSCNMSYTQCDDCRIYKNNNNYFIKLNNSNDQNCYPKNKTIRGYIYNDSLQIYESCFHTCKSCYKKGELSSQIEQNCLSCEDGYYPSFEYQGNCYQIKDGEKDEDKIVKSKSDIYFTSKTCPEGKQFKIALTGECVASCPITSNYYEYNYINFTEQDNNIEKQYTQSKKLIFNYTINKVCYSEYPEDLIFDINSISDSDKNENSISYEITSDKTENSISDKIESSIFDEIENSIFSEIESSIFDENEDHSEVNKLINNETCDNKIKVIDNNECADSFNECIDKNYKIFNNFCYKNGCPLNTKSEIDNHFCQCSHFYYNNTENNALICLEESENCYSQDYLYLNPESLECFKTLDECFIKNHLYYFNNNCYKSECPKDKILLTSIVNQTIKDNILQILNIEQNLENKICVCNNILSANYIINNGYNGSQLCISNPFEEYENQCIKEIYPQEYYSDPDSCFFIYQNKCMTYSPEDTCVSQENSNLVCSIEIKLDMKIFNFICFKNFLEIEKNLIKISSGNVPISTSSGIFIFAYNNKSNLDDTLKNYTNLSILYLNQCEDKLKEKYNLSPEEKIYVLGIDSPNLIKRSPTNVYNFEIFLENGTQIEDLSICEGTDLTLSSPIINEKLIHFEEAVHFASMGYNIYNRDDKFYNDYCSPASINHNDITLYDRYKDFYPTNISFCNDTCKFSYVNLTSKRIICLCQPYNYERINDINEDEINYSNYLLSLINYKIVVCYELFFDIKNYGNNYGFFIGIGGLIFCIIELGIFMTFGIKLFRKQLIDNFPRKNENEYIKNKFSKNNKNNSSASGEQNTQFKTINKESFILNHNLNNEKHNLINNPPRKGINIFNINNNNNNIDKTIIYNQSSNKSFDTKKEVRKFNKNRIKTIKIIKRKKRSNSSYIKKNKTLFSNQKLNNKSISNENNNDISKLEVIEKSKSNLKINNEEILYIDSPIKIDPLINYNNYIIIDDNSVDKKEINNVPYTQALRIDKRNFLDIYLSVLYNEIKFINIFYYKNPYVHLSLPVSIYFFSELLDFGINCFIYSDDEVSEKYHNNGSLKVFTSLSLSFLSNIFSNIIVFIISKLTNFSEIIEIMIKDVRIPEDYQWNIVRITKYTRIKLFIHYFIQFVLILFIIYYLFIFCTVYHNSQISAGLNYLIGVFESFGISVILALITSIMRFLSLKYKNSRLYNISKYFYQHF